VDQKILELLRTDSRYAYEAYEFVCDAVTYAQERLGRIPVDEDEPEADYHVSGEELTRAACELAVEEFGMMAAVVFKQWGIRTTGDFGKIVFNLIQSDRLSKSDRDELEDFHDLFDLDKALSEGFAITAGDCRPSAGKGRR